MTSMSRMTAVMPTNRRTTCLRRWQEEYQAVAVDRQKRCWAETVVWAEAVVLEDDDQNGGHRWISGHLQGQPSTVEQLTEGGTPKTRSINGHARNQVDGATNANDGGTSSRETIDDSKIRHQNGVGIVMRRGNHLQSHE